MINPALVINQMQNKESEKPVASLNQNVSCTTKTT